jgi:flagellin
MSLRIQENGEAFNAHRHLVSTTNSLAKTMERLSSGFAINRAADDPAGLAIAEKLHAQVQGIAQAEKNVGDAISVTQTAEGALNEVESMMQRVRDLAVESKNGSMSTSDKESIQAEVNQLASQIQQIGEDTEFNGIKLLSQKSLITFQVGANDGETISISTISLGESIGAETFVLAEKAEEGKAATGTIAKIDKAIEAISAQRSGLGAEQNRLEDANSNLAVYNENLSASEGQIRDADMASEMVTLTQLEIMQQAGTAMLAQAQQSGSIVLSLLQA